MDNENQNTPTPAINPPEADKEQSQPVRNDQEDKQPEKRERLWKAESEIPYRSTENKDRNQAEEGE